MGKLSKPLLKQYSENIDKLTPGELVLLREEIEEQIKPLKNIQEMLKDRFKQLLGENDEMNVLVPSFENPKVTFPFRIYKQFTRRYERLTLEDAERIIKDGDLVDVICDPRVVNFDRAEEALPKNVLEELKGARKQLEPTISIKVGMAKRQ